MRKAEAVRDTVLVVDDLTENIELLHHILKGDYTVKIARNGAQALRVAGASLSPDLILLDIMMPEMNGYDVCRRLKDDVRTMDIPVIFVTAKTEARDEALGFAVGAVDYITKPVSPPLVLARVATHMELHKAHHHLKQMLRETAGGIVTILVDLLSISNPAAFKRGQCATRMVKAMAAHLELEEAWRYELASSLSQIGCVTLPTETVAKLGRGAPLSNEEQSMCAGIAATGAELLSRVPRLEPLAGMVGLQDVPYDQARSMRPAPAQDVLFGGQLLKIALDYQDLFTSGLSPAGAVQQMRGRGGEYDPRLLSALTAVLRVAARQTEQDERITPVNEVIEGMIVSRGVYASTGALPAAKGTVVTETIKTVLYRFSRNGLLPQTITVAAPQDAE